MFDLHSTHFSRRYYNLIIPSRFVHNAIKNFRVVDIKKYLAQTQNNPHLSGGNSNKDFGNDIWQHEKHHWMQSNGVARTESPARSLQPHDDHHLEVDDLSDVASNSSIANNVGHRPMGMMKRSLSGHSLNDLEYLKLQQEELQQQPQQPRKSSEAAGAGSGKKNFRSKRFSRNMEREPALRRAQSLHNHMDRRSGIFQLKISTFNLCLCSIY